MCQTRACTFIHIYKTGTDAHTDSYRTADQRVESFFRITLTYAQHQIELDEGEAATSTVEQEK